MKWMIRRMKRVIGILMAGVEEEEAENKRDGCRAGKKAIRAGIGRQDI